MVWCEKLFELLAEEGGEEEQALLEDLRVMLRAYQEELDILAGCMQWNRRKMFICYICSLEVQPTYMIPGEIFRVKVQIR